jgi:serine/threonine-protein kinase PknK
MSGMFELDGFEPIKRVGGGGFGDVWLARQTNVDRHVAVKVGHAPIQDETIRLRFDRECKALGRLSGHPNIIDVYTAGSLDDGRPYLVLEYISGGTLWQRLKRSPLTDDELISIGGQMAGALQVAHSAGVLHRDLKPENILIRSNGDAVLGDFGIARLQDGASTTSAAITASVAYAAPEVLSGKRATVASDLYGVGVCLLAAIIRSVPYVEKSDSSIHPIINRVLTDHPPDIRSRGVSEELAAIVDSLLEKDPARRPADAAEVQARFEAVRARRLLAGSGATQVVAGDPVGVPTPPPVPASQRQPSWPSALDGGWDAPERGGPAHEPRLRHHQEVVTGPGNLRLFVLAYAATLVVGGLLLYLVMQLRADDESQGLDARIMAAAADRPVDLAMAMAPPP